MPERRIEGLITRIDGQKAFGEYFLRQIQDLDQGLLDLKIRWKNVKPVNQ